MSKRLAAARAAYARRDWATARAGFAAAREPGGLTADDLFAEGDAAWWLGDFTGAVTASEAAHRAYLAAGQPRLAARAAITVAVTYLLRGEVGLGSGWMARVARLVEDDQESYEYGLVLYLTSVMGALEQAEEAPEAEAAAFLAAARRVRELGHRCGEPDLVVCGLVGEGRLLVRRGRVREGLARLDEALVCVVTEQLRPDIAGDAYCQLMATAHELFELRRARDWTEATTRWLSSLPAAVLFTGICRVHRAQVHYASGAWELATQEATRVCEELAELQPGSAAEAHYQLGEVWRGQGELQRAEAAYQRAHRLGRDPQPGLALLRLAQGQVAAATAAIRGALAAESTRLARARLCAAQVEIALAAADPGTARKAQEELAETAAAYGSAGLAAMATQARGTVLLGDGQPEEALPVLREACRRWQELRVPYECARVRTLLAVAYQQIGDTEAAALERQAAAETCIGLGAATPAPLEPVTAAGRGRLPAGLTDRELDVLRLVAAGRSNRQIAASLVISEKTVARHVSNIFTKLRVGSRTEAASYAYTHGLAASATGVDG